MTFEEFERRFKARIVERLLMPQEAIPGDEMQEEEEIFTSKEAEVVAHDQWTSVSAYEHADGFEDDPEGAADEEMSYWSD